MTHYPIPFAPEYIITDEGLIINARRRYVKLTKNSNGYLVCAIQGEQYRVNRLVCEAFHGPAPTIWHVAAHKDGNRQDNSADNLYWAMPEDNVMDTIKHGSFKGSKHPRAILSEQDVLSIRARRGNGEKLTDIVKDYSVCYATISHVCNRRNWK